MALIWERERTRLINRLHALFVGAGITTVTKKDLARDESRRSMLEMLFGVYEEVAGHLVAILAEVEQQIAKLDQSIRKVLIDRREQAALLMSIPGVGPVATATFLGYVGDGSRFETASQVSYYAGLVSRLDAAEVITDLTVPPGNRLEKLKGDRKGQYSIRVNDQWRICFQWKNNDAYEVEITDYHSEE